MAEFISPQRKQEIIVSLEKIIQESAEKISLYSDIYTYVDDMEPTHIPDSTVLPLKGDVLREVFFQAWQNGTEDKKTETNITRGEEPVYNCRQLWRRWWGPSRTSSNVRRGDPGIIQDFPKPGKTTAKRRQKQIIVVFV